MISLPELLLIVIVALVVLGPDKLPMVAKFVAQALQKFQLLQSHANNLWQEQLQLAQLQENEQRASTASQQYLQKKHQPHESNSSTSDLD